jgi:phosphoserine phosphatase RsbU/P
MSYLDEAAVLQVLGELLDRAHLGHPDRLVATIEKTLASVGWGVTVYLVDYQQRELRPLVAEGDPPAVQSVDGSLAGRCFRHGEPVTAQGGDAHVWVPLIDGVDRLGVLRLTLPADHAIDDPATAAHVRWVAYLTGHLLAGKSHYADHFHIARLTHPRSVPSEVIWSMLPPVTVAAEGVAIAGGLEPTHSVAGDIFDYAIDADTVHVAIADATGHDLNSALIGATVLGAYRSSRRRLLALDETVDEIDGAITAIAPHTYATGVFGQLSLATGVFRYLNAGHPAPLLLRASKVVKQLEGGRRIVLGHEGRKPTIASEQLEHGDWLVLYTDGVPEARDDRRQFFGLDRLIDVIERSAADRRSAAETLRKVMHAVLDHQHNVLQDDASLVVVQWMTGLEHELDAM